MNEIKEIEERFRRARYEELSDFDKPGPEKPTKAIYVIIGFVIFMAISGWHDEEMRKAEKCLEKQGYSDQQIRDWLEDQATMYSDHP